MSRRKHKSKIMIVIGIIIFILGLVFISTLSTTLSKVSPNQLKFENGKLPDPLPDGDYKGSADINQGEWIGKQFNRGEQSGTNNFVSPTGNYQLYKFKTYVGKGLADPNLDVLKIDYNMPENPIYTRIILDEIVQVGEGKYLGKVHLRLIPFVPFTITYFYLEK